MCTMPAKHVYKNFDSDYGESLGAVILTARTKEHRCFFPLMRSRAEDAREYMWFIYQQQFGGISSFFLFFSPQDAYYSHSHLQ